MRFEDVDLDTPFHMLVPLTKKNLFGQERIETNAQTQKTTGNVKIRIVHKHL